ncbi:hypothetical protein B1759_16210 [Rubrivirga sp. SAORIC476]|nr:hypothetical protein B1759_16210 [Rubrivirga sp. SAORIC476]
MRQMLSLARQADAAGLDVVGVGEHHGLGFVNSATAATLAAMAAVPRSHSALWRSPLRRGIPRRQTRPPGRKQIEHRPDLPIDLLGGALYERLEGTGESPGEERRDEVALPWWSQPVATEDGQREGEVAAEHRPQGLSEGGPHTGAEEGPVDPSSAVEQVEHPPERRVIRLRDLPDRSVVEARHGGRLVHEVCQDTDGERLGRVVVTVERGPVDPGGTAEPGDGEPVEVLAAEPC